MDSVFTRTSVTVDEAVAILLGWADGPIVFRPVGDDASPEEQDEADSQIFVLLEHLDEKTDSLESDLAEAIFDNLPQQIIDEKRAALQKHRAVFALAKSYLCAVNGEINEGSESALRVDLSRSTIETTYITLASLDEWAVKKGYRERILTPLATDTPSKVKPAMGKEKTTGRRKQPDQEEAIMAELKRLGHNPLELPINESGRAGVKKVVWNSLQVSDLFGTVVVFEKAWERLRKNQHIVDKT